jgi:outer membrane lipoprotein carrier protein
MNRAIKTLVAIASLLLAPSIASAEPQLAREQLDRFAEGLTSFHASFEQQVVDSDGAVQDSSRGEVWLRKPGLFRWEYGGDFPELVIADGEKIWIYDEMLEQVTVRNQSAAAVDSPLTLLTEPGRLDEQFEVRDVGEADGMALLELRARSQDLEFERILVGLRGDMLQSMILEDAFGLRTEIRFSDPELNPEIEDRMFRFSPPANADVIGDLADFGGTP